METYNAKKVNLDVISQNFQPSYMDNDIMIIDDLKTFNIEDSVQMDMIVLLVCTKGKMQVDFNNTTHTVHKDELIICPPTVFVSNCMITTDFSAKVMGLSYTAMQRLLHIDKNIWTAVMHIKEKPVYHLDQRNIELLSHYYNIVVSKLRQEDCVFRQEIMHALFAAMCYEVGEIIKPEIDAGIEDEPTIIKQGDQLTKRFIKLLADCQGKVRSVNAFADKLYVTPKYLSTCCKKSSGKTALEWIHEYTIEVIVQQLKYSDLSIKEISDDLDFPNLSFFGKFVKSQLGVSPTAYRKQLVKKKLVAE